MIDDKFWHIKNVASSMRVTLKGMLIDFIAVCANANIPIFSNVLGKETICNLVHPSKTSQPISLQFLGSMIDINLESKSLSELSERVHEKALFIKLFTSVSAKSNRRMNNKMYYVFLGRTNLDWGI